MRLPLRGVISVSVVMLLASFVACGRSGKRPPLPQDQSPPESDIPAPVPLPPDQPNVPQPSPPTGGIVDQQQFMIFHNLKRCWHDAPKIKWSDSLASKAKAIADKCDFNYEAPAVSTGHGEGLDIVKALDQWYLEGMIWFPYGKNEIPDGMGRFAAMIWKDTKEMGCAATSCNGEPYFVCAYSGEVDKAKAAANVSGLKPDFLTCTGM